MTEPATPSPLGPGDDDPKSPRGTTIASLVVDVDTAYPLWPGDEDRRSVVKTADDVARAPLGPGDSDGDNPDEAFHFITPVPAGPGDSAAGPRHVVKVPKKQQTAAVTANEE